MKAVLRVLNVIIMGLSLAAAVLLFVTPPFVFNSDIAVNVKAFSKFVPETTYSTEIDIPKLLGVDTIHVGIKFNLDNKGIQTVMSGDRTKINDAIITENVNNIVATLHEPVDLITDFTIKSTIKSIIKTEVTKEVKRAIEESEYSSQIESTPEQIIEEAGIDDEYFTNFSLHLYDAANTDTATVDSVSAVLFQEIDEIIAKVDDYNIGKDDEEGVHTTAFGEENKNRIKDNLVETFNSLKLVDSGGNIKKISHIAYIYLADHLKTTLNGKVPAETLEQQAGENSSQYADRLLSVFVTTQMPEQFYTGVGYVSLGLFIGLFVFTAIWLFLFVFTLIKTFTKKPWTIFGPWFWIIGGLQLVLGIGLVVLGKTVLPGINVASLGLPIGRVIFSARTYAFIPSLIYVACIALAIVYAIIKAIAKKADRG